MTVPLVPSGAGITNDEACAREPIHRIGHTQSYGVFIAVSEPDFVVRHISANVANTFSTPAIDVIDRPLEALLGTLQFRNLHTRLAGDDLRAVNPLPIRVGTPACDLDCSVHRDDGLLRLEIEPQSGAHPQQPLNIATDLQAPIARMEDAANIDQLADIAATEFQRTSGFGRVMVYRFDADWNGRVIAEVSTIAPAYLGLQFPASDIPPQARHLFSVNPLRAIVDVDSEPVPIVGITGPHGGPSLDLSRSLLRSASAVHVQYLQNMGVKASLTVSIVVRGELWGMVTAHHHAPHRINFSGRSILGLLGQILAAQILARLENAALQERLKSREPLEAYIRRHSSLPWHGDAAETKTLLELLHADALVSEVDGVPFRYETTLDETQLPPLLATMRARASHGIASSDNISGLDPGARVYAPDASGALYLGLSDTSDDYIMLLRREVVRTIVWGGDPEKTVVVDPDSGRLHPRASFTPWQETVRGRSQPWTELELEHARLLRERLRSTRLETDRNAALVARDAKSRFLATMSHEIRTPMNGIIGMTELLALTALTREQRDYVRIVRDSGHSLLRVLDDILDYSKIEAGKLHLEIIDFDLASQIDSVVLLLQAQFTIKTVSLTTHTDDNVARKLRGDPGRLRQILINLLGNALKFTPAGRSVQLIISGEPALAPAVGLRFAIVDTGVGIAAEDQNHLFEPFSQVDDSTTRKYGGTGLGLSICKRLVGLMGGQIGFTSAAGRGSCFWFSIPFLLGNLSDRRQERTPDGGRTVVQARPERLLLAEDNVINALLATKQFKHLGFSTTLVSNGREAVDAIKKERFDIVFMDCYMPVLDGFDATREIRRLVCAPGTHLPIIAMTANVQAEDEQQCSAAGMDDYIAKPCEIATLRAMLDRWLPGTAQGGTE